MLMKKLISSVLEYGTILQRQVYNIRYTKEYFQQLDKDHDAIAEKAKQSQIKQKKRNIFNMKGNEKNEANRVQVKFTKPSVIANKLKQQYVVDKCAIVTPEPRKERVFISAKRKYIITSIKKAKNALACVKKLYVLDAIHVLQQSQKKVAKLMIPTFYNLINHALDRDYDPTRLFVHGLIIGKTQRYKGVRYHAKSKRGMENKDFCQVKVVLYEKDEKQFFEQVGTGKAPPGFASFLRQRLVDIDANYHQLVQCSGITTAKGRQQKRQILKRRVDMMMKQNQQNNTYVPKKILHKQLTEEEGMKTKDLLKNLRKDGVSELPSLKRREQLFKKNIGIE